MKNFRKKALSLILSVLMILSSMVSGAFVLVAGADSTGRITSSGYNIVIGVPETVYMTSPNNYNTTTTSVRYYVNNTVNSSGVVSLDQSNGATAGKFYIYSPQISSISSVSVNGASLSGFSASNNGSLFYDDSFTMSLSSGISSSQTKTLEWTINCVMTNGASATFYAYTVAYAPYLSPIFAAGRTKNTRGSNSFGSGMSWVSGIHGISTAGGYYPYDNFLPLCGGPTTSGGESSPDAWFNSNQQCGLPTKGGWYTSKEYGYNYGDETLCVFERSAEGYINVDTSRYTNMNQIPNLTCGISVTDAEGVSNGNIAAYVGKLTNAGDRIQSGRNWYTRSETTPSEWNASCTIYGGDRNKNKNKAYIVRDVRINSSIANGWMYIRGALGTYSGGDNCFAILDNYLNVITVNKSSWRTAVQNAQKYGFQSGWYSNANDFNNWKNYLKSVAEALGNPTVTSCSNVTNLNNYVNTLRTSYSGDNAAKVNDLGVVKVIKSDGTFSNEYKIVNISGVNNPVETENFYVGDTVILKSASIANFTYKCNVYMANQKAVGTTFTNADLNAGLGSAGTAATANFNGITQSQVSGKQHQRTFYYLGNDVTVTVDPNGGSWNGNISKVNVTGSYSGTFSPSVPTRTGYTFNGWTLSGGGSLSGSTYTFGSSAGTLTADWTINKYNVSYVDEDGSVLESKAWNYGSTPSYSGSTPTKPCDDENHYIFAGWTPTESTVTDDITYTATYTAVAHTLEWMNTDKDSHYQYCTGCDYVVNNGTHNIVVKTDSEHHWNYCPTCGYTSPKEAHTLIFKTYPTMHRYECSCGYIEGEENHTLSIKSDENGHWYESDDGCGYKSQTYAHDGTLVIGDTQHYYYCETCTRSYNFENHDYVLLDNVFDEDTHTYRCSCSKEKKEEHVFVDASGKCQICKYSQNDLADYTEVNEALDKVPSDTEIKVFYENDANYEILQLAVASVKWNCKSAEQTKVNAFAKAIDDAVDGLTIKTYPVNGLPADCTLSYKKTPSTNHYMLATVKAPIKNSAGKYFSYWVDENGNVASTYLNYTFYSIADRTLTPVYGQELTADDYVSSYVAGVRNNLDGTYSILVEHSASQKVEILEHGVLFTYDSGKTDKLVRGSETDGVFNPVAASTASTRTGLFEITIDAKDASENIYLRPYVLNKETGEPVYGENASFTLDTDFSTQAFDVIDINEFSVNVDSVEPLSEEVISEGASEDEPVKPDYQLTIWEKIAAFFLGIWKYIMSFFSF